MENSSCGGGRRIKKSIHRGWNHSSVLEEDELGRQCGGGRRTTTTWMKRF